MAVELAKGKPRPIDFTLDGEKLAAKPMPFRLFMELAGAENGEISLEAMGQILLEVVVYQANGERVFKDVDQVLDWDGNTLAKLFKEVSRQAMKTTNAAKN